MARKASCRQQGTLGWPLQAGFRKAKHHLARSGRRRPVLRLDRWCSQKRGRYELQDSVYTAETTKRLECRQPETRHRACSCGVDASGGLGCFPEGPGKSVSDVFLRAEKK